MRTLWGMHGGLTSVLTILLSTPGVAPWAGYVSALEKVRPQQRPATLPSAHLRMARGECEGVQVAIQPGAEQVRASARSPAQALTLRLHRVAYVPVRIPSNNEGAVGLWPDPLIPVSDGYAREERRALPADSTDGRPLVLYLELCAPLHAKPGKVRGHTRLTARNKTPLALPWEVEVLSFELPATSSLPNSFGISKYSIARGHRLPAEGEAMRRLLRDYGAALLQHRLSAYGMGMDPPPVRFERGQALVDFSAYDEELAPFLDGTVLPSGARFTTTDLRESPVAKTDEEKVSYYRAFQEHFRTKGWRATLFFYAKDEPRPEHYPWVRQQAARVRRAGNVPVLVTTAFEKSIAPHADILAPPLNCFFPRPGLATCDRVHPLSALRQRGARTVWWYQSCNAHGCDLGPIEDPQVSEAYSRWASYMVDHGSTRNRAMGPLAYLEGVDGELYFDTVFAYNELDPWNGVYAFGGNGDGTLFYPGTPGLIGGKRHIPIESLRLKHLRDGLEDYEYLRLAEKLGDKAFARSAVRRWVRSGYDVCQSANEWEKVRKELSIRIARRWAE